MTITHMGILLSSWLGFLALALATERWSRHLLRRVPAPGWRLGARAVGWGLLALALAGGVAGFGAGVGVTLWLGWLSIAALTLVFGFSQWPWQPPARTAHERRKPSAQDRDAASAEPVDAASRSALRWWAFGFLAGIPLVYGLALQAVPVKPLLRPDAIEGQVGPWTFRLAETERRAPVLVAMEIPMKSYQVRFCASCDAEIRAAYLKVNKPRSLRAAGIGLVGERWDRYADIQLPGNTNAESALWLTVVGKDGSVHQTWVPMEAVSPTTVAWFQKR